MPRPKSDAAQSILFRYKQQPDKDPDTVPGMRYAVEKRNGPMSFARLATMSTLAVAKRFASGQPGDGRIVDIRSKRVVATYLEGDVETL